MKNLRAVATIAVLRVLKVHGQDQIALVKSTGDEYWFEAAATDADDGFLIVKPTDIATGNPGRWKLFE